jgi:Ca2+-binding EF-hand superfamily protein
MRSSLDLPDIQARPRSFDSHNAQIGLESREVTLTRVRRKLTAAGFRHGRSWEELFNRCDKNTDGCLDWRELKLMVRDTMKIPNATVCDNELLMLWQEIDKDASNSIDLTELLGYLQHGAVRPQDQEAKMEQRLKRVQRNLRVAFASVSANEGDIRKLFDALDRDGSNTLSLYEFHSFVRDELGMSRWDVSTNDLNDFFKALDPNGDGIDINELLTYVRKVGKDRSVSASDCLSSPATKQKHRKFKTYKQSLADAGPSRSTSLPNVGLRNRNPTSSFCVQGRERMSRTRLATSLTHF